MLPTGVRPSLNATVEDDEGNERNTNPMDTAGGTQYSWPEVLKTQMQRSRSSGAFGTAPDLSPTNSSDSPSATATSSCRMGEAPAPVRPKRRKRVLVESNEAASRYDDDMSSAEMLRAHKQKRLDVSLPGGDEDVRNVTPVSMETEDISAEVQRRLKLKEEQRKKRHSKPEKRKRGSLTSNGSTSPGNVSKPRKKAKVDISHGVFGMQS
ncbi:hypothetical protein EYZ11_000529 [Aspergillus tanneri]|uniref:Uncharacterized protein n=1 Tax=Aspergillus tanneri TaxID=1220188 RepID=A0A4V3UQQ2_9EURO|nr:hypothetical protein EYZ11_000529 [Aspergillus tanneri]